MRNQLDAHVGNLGYALLLKRYRPDIENATAAQIDQAANATIPECAGAVLVIPFHGGSGLLVHPVVRHGLLACPPSRSLTDMAGSCAPAFGRLPLPWIAAELGWIVAEYGRQPWVIEGVLPTALGVSSTDPGNVLFSLLGFGLFYSALLVVDFFLLFKYVRLGPDVALLPGPRIAEAAAE